VLCLALGVALPGPARGEPSPSGEKPPWQRDLTGADKREVDALTNELKGPRPVEAIRAALRRIVAIRTRAQGPDHWQTIDARKQLEETEWQLSAEADKVKALEESSACERHAAQCVHQGRFAEAERWFRQTLALRRRALPPGHHLTAATCDNLGYCLARQNRYAESEPYLREALAARRKELGDEHPLTATSCSNLGVTLASEGKVAEAADHQQKAVDIRSRVLGPLHPLTLESQAALGVTRTQLPRAPAQDADIERMLRVHGVGMGRSSGKRVKGSC
jgi:tetratricopeptide (TPR) repeat protein